MASSSNSAFASTSASTSTVDGNNSYPYDVFLNHRGTDVKETFASALYDGLKAHRLEVFLDKKEMRTGQKLTCQIQGAIRAASVNIAIFSPRYCESHWCLDELVLMLESMREKRSTILPVFFRVKPSELRCTEGGKGVYSRDLLLLQNKRKFESPEPRYDYNTIRKWKNALSEVAEISGFELEEKPYNGDEGKLLAAVVERVREIVPKILLDVSTFPTGLDDKVEDFKKSVLWQQHESGKARVVGIVGLGGVGKTTLSKKFFNSESTNYRRSSFLSDVRENASTGSLNSLQRILIKDLTQRDVQINNHEGKTLLKKYLSSSHSLIIIDDVDQTEQLDALVSPAKDVLSSNSLILVTSRDKGVLKSWGIDDLFIYELKGLDPQHSTKLFCSQAFHRPRPDAGFEHVVKEFVDACDGLPLSLKVIGALLHGEKNLEIWKAQLSKLSKILPEKIQNTLKISYDSLDKEDKLIFLDTACFFIGKEKDRAIRIWDGSGWHGSLGFQNLQNKCLVEVKVDIVWDGFGDSRDAECIRMHDHVRDLGRSLADEEPSRRRIWRVTKNLSDQSPVRGVKTSAECDRLVTELRRKLPGYKGSCVESVFSVEQAPQLILLRLYNCPYSFDLNISTENLRILYIQGSNLEKLWESQAPLQAPLQLRELYIEAPRLFKIPESIGQLKRLEKIVLQGSGTSYQLPLETLPDEFCQLASLKHLELRFCKYLRSLPDSFGNLTSLQHINFHNCLEMLPDSFGKLTKLQHLFLIGSSELQMLPDSLGNLTELQRINLRCCQRLRMLPNSFGNLTKLQRIDLSFCTRLQMLPNSFGNLTKLQHIDLNHCTNLQMLPNSFGNLTKLQHIDLNECTNLQMLPNSFGNLTKLQHIDLRGCERLRMLPNSFGNLTKLQHIDMNGCTNLQMLPNSFGNLTKLQHIDLNDCTNLQMLPNSFGNLKQLKFLCLDACMQLTVSSETLGNITTLEDFSLSDFSLSRPWLSAPENIKVLPSQLTYQQSLQRLFLGFDFKELPTAIGNLSNLKVLRLASSCLEMLPPSFGDLRSLEELMFRSCPLKCFPDSTRMLTQLKKLRISCIKNLERLEIKECPSREVGGEIETATDSKGRGVLSKLDASEASYSNAVFPNLQHLHIDHCDHLVEVGALPTTLQTLDIVELPSMELLSMETWVSLEKLAIGRCRKLKRIHGLAQLTKLEFLRVRHCSELEELPGVEHSRSLESVIAYECPELPRKYESLHRTCHYTFWTQDDFNYP